MRVVPACGLAASSVCWATISTRVSSNGKFVSRPHLVDCLVSGAVGAVAVILCCWPHRTQIGGQTDLFPPYQVTVGVEQDDRQLGRSRLPGGQIGPSTFSPCNSCDS